MSAAENRRDLQCRPRSGSSPKRRPDATVIALGLTLVLGLALVATRITYGHPPLGLVIAHAAAAVSGLTMVMLAIARGRWKPPTFSALVLVVLAVTLGMTLLLLHVLHTHAPHEPGAPIPIAMLVAHAAAAIAGVALLIRYSRR
jgi:drug/metabolite transporter (DMT)-like permease